MKPKFIATRDFTDSGSEREFKAGPMPEGIDAGVLANYEAAGLIRKPTDADEIAADPAPVDDATVAAKKPGRRSTAKRSNTKSTASKLN